MTTESIVTSSIDVEIKNEAAQILESMGLTISDGIRLFLYQVTTSKALPFNVETLNSVTLSALESARDGKDCESVSLDQLALEWDEECGK